MIETLTFRTQARTIDHLGREQIADCPTAITELWKNSYDAYAKSVALHIFDDDEPVAAIVDDGHGMSPSEFVDRWLVIGTESKFVRQPTRATDRNGLSERTKQGQKGIGRLSSANLGPLLLVVSKRKRDPFVAALIDWRIFENPYLVLSDIQVPVVQFEERNQLFETLPDLFDKLTDNVWGSTGDVERSQRLGQAWAAYDAVVQEQDSRARKPSEEIGDTIVRASFDEQHIRQWPVWSGESDSGTAMLVSNINYDLRAQLPQRESDGAIESIRRNLFATLSAFTDPFAGAEANEANAIDPKFNYEVVTWSQGTPKHLIGEGSSRVSRQITDEMEHVISGNFDEDGVFRGQIKAFGEWRRTESDYLIRPPADYTPPRGPRTFVGPFSLHLSTYERQRSNSTHSDDQHARIDALAEHYAGFMIYRNGLRILPYGRVDSDFFEIEQRRSMSAGREFWNARRMFGRVALSRELNPNLRDKAGREGFIDNRAAKALRVLVVNVLRTSAREYFGSNSELRKDELSNIQEGNKKAKAERERKALAKRNRKQFRTLLGKNLPRLEKLVERLSAFHSRLNIQDESDLAQTQIEILDIEDRIAELRIVGAPSNLGSSEEKFREFRRLYSEAQNHLVKLRDVRSEALERIEPAKPLELLERTIAQLAGQIHARTRRWQKQVDELLSSETQRIMSLFAERNRAFHEQASAFVTQVENQISNLDDALTNLAEVRREIDEQNEDIFESYIATLELLRDNIDVQLIARQGTTDNAELRDELTKLNQVAQLGIAVEIVGHELYNNQRLIREGLSGIKALGSPPGTRQIEMGFEALSQQLEFLSPLRISGAKNRRTVIGREIFDYLTGFFSSVSRSRDVRFTASEQFRRLSVEEVPSRLLPVFVNLTNNSIYWLTHQKTPDPEVRFDVVDGSIVVADNGPGIDPLDVDRLFSMFFTRKTTGGRGIGLYLCRMNLAVGGHSIRYAEEEKYHILSGANFVLTLRGAQF